MPTPISSDKTLIDQMVKSFFNVFTNRNSSPDFDLLYRLCIPEAQIILRTLDSHTVYNLESFIQPRKVILTDGTLTDFEESEITERTDIIGNLAQRFSKYQKSGLRDAKPFKQEGNKMFQLVKLQGHWKISAVIWEDI